MRRGSAEMRAEMNKIFWAADSTVQTNDFTTYPQTGIGQVFPLFVKKEYQVVNHAKNGRSTKSFMDEGRLKAIEEQIGAGDFLFIQFGHEPHGAQESWREKQQKMVHVLPGGRVQESSGEIRGQYAFAL